MEAGRDKVKVVANFNLMKQIEILLDDYKAVAKSKKDLESVQKMLLDQSMLPKIQSLKELLAKQNPLYGSVDLTIELKPMDYYESALFYEKFSDEDKVRLYSVFGGIPYYNRLIDSDKSVKENIIELIATPGARLENEVSMYLNSEISKITNANEVFEVLARGFSKYKDILEQSNVSSGPTLVDVLEKLIRMDVVKKEAPINDESNKRKAGYFISDNLFLFYYKYIFRNISRMNIMEPETFYKPYTSSPLPHPPILPRCNPFYLLKHPGEVIGVIHTALLTNLFDGQIGEAKQLLCLGGAYL